MLRVLKNQFVRLFVRRRTFLVYIVLVLALIFFIQSNLLTNRMSIHTMRQIVANKTVSNKSETMVEYSNVKVLSSHGKQLPKSPDSYLPANSTIKQLQSSAVKYRMGHVNVHLWYKMCTSTIDSLRQLPLFPLWPSIRGQPEMPNELVSVMSSTWSAERVMGRLYPPQSGQYSFELTSGMVSEFWLSTGEDPKNSLLLAKINKNRLFGVNFAKGKHMPKSKLVPLVHGRVYYFEMIHGMNGVSRDSVQVRWMLPGAEAFTPIPKTSISTVIINDTSHDKNTREFVTSSPSLNLQEITLKKHTPHTWTNVNFSKPFSSYPPYTRDNVYTLKFGDRAKVMSAFEECEYSPSYTKRTEFKRYQGVYWTHFNDVFPNDHTHEKIWQGFHEVPDRKGNSLIDEGTVVVIVKMFIAHLEAKYPGEYKLANVVSVERNVDGIRGNRFLLELVLEEVKTKQLQRFSEYVFQFKNTSDVLCRPKGLSWSPTSKIYAIITTKNQGPWVVHYIKNMAQAIHSRNDEHVHFLVVDYGNNGIDIEDELKRNGLKSYTVIKKTGKFHKTLAIHDAVNSIKDKNSIVFLTDLHLDVPKDLFENVRKHTIQGIMTFTPVVFRLKHCGRPESDQTTTTGYWDSYAFGIYSAYKSDWEYFGGVNVEEFKNKWGGEDWEMVDRVLAKGLEIDRVRLPFFYHFFHDKHGMWEQA